MTREEKVNVITNRIIDSGAHGLGYHLIKAIITDLSDEKLDYWITDDDYESGAEGEE